MKHALMARIITHLNAKESAYRIIDLHGGAGWYDLASQEALRTGEWREGIGLLDAPLDAEAKLLLEPYRHAIAATRQLKGASAYPGSPMIASWLSRRQDRIIANEKHGETCAELRVAMSGEGRCRVLELDGSVALRANIPPRERRGLVLLDPPFERHDEFAALVKDIVAAHEKWPQGIYAIWYPLKDHGLADRFFGALTARGLSRMLRLEMTVHQRDVGMGGSGLLVINPPWKLHDEARILLPALVKRLATGAGSHYRCEAILPDG